MWIEECAFVDQQTCTLIFDPNVPPFQDIRRGMTMTLPSVRRKCCYLYGTGEWTMSCFLFQDWELKNGNRALTFFSTHAFCVFYFIFVHGLSLCCSCGRLPATNEASLSLKKLEVSASSITEVFLKALFTHHYIWLLLQIVEILRWIGDY